MTGGDRGRIPFAVLGVLVLLSSVTLVATTEPPGSPAPPRLDRAMEGTAAETQTALREAVRTASRAAAEDPVIEPANTTVGRALNDSRPFRDALRLRVYLAARERLAGIERRRGVVRTSAALPAPGPEGPVVAARRHVQVRRAGENRSGIRVAFENVTLTATRRGRVVSERRTSPTLVVASPVLAMHDRVTAYQRQLDAGVASPGLDQRLTAQLYGLAWTRGYAQYLGAPVASVIDNRHVALATNAGLLDAQRATVGHADPTGRRTLAVAAARTGARDALAAGGAGGGGGGGSGGPAQAVLDRSTRPPPNDLPGLDRPSDARPDDRQSVAVDRTADAAFLDLLRNGTLNATIDAVYEADARLASRVVRLSGDRPAAPPSPGRNWTLVDEDRSATVDAERTGVEDGEGSTTGRGGRVEPPAAPDGWHRLAAFGRRTTVERTRTRTWQRGEERRTTRTEAAETSTVAVAALGRHAGDDPAPDGPVRPVHERGAGPLDGPNMAGVRDRALERLVEDRGGADAIAARAATGRLDADPVGIEAERPDELRRWIYRDLADLRERVANVSVAVRRSEVGTFGANPPSRLRTAVADRRSDLVAAPAAYDGVAARARIAVRSAYLDRVAERLGNRAERRSERGDRFGDALPDVGAGSLADARRSLRAARGPAPERQPVLEGPGGPVRLRVDGAPAYLSTAKLDRDRVPALDEPGHPLVARNVNVFTVPYAGVANSLVGDLFGSGGHVRLDTAARTLRAANATADAVGGNETLADRRRDLARAVADSGAYLEGALRDELRAAGVGDSRGDRRRIVAAGLDRWDGTATRALALANGSAGAAVAETAADREGLSDVDRDRLRLVLQDRLRDERKRSEARPDVEAVDRTRRLVRGLAEERVGAALEARAKSAAERIAEKRFDAVPAGAPLAPAPGYWYATANVWRVTVRGEYARFGVRAERGRPGAAGGEIPYVRDGSAVRVDADGDGEREVLGRASRVDFDVSTTVVVVVPPGKDGVGDRDGVADERSAGWPRPGSGSGPEPE